ncbi:MAG: aquaporin [bacterium]|nr:aquaporin [bacterium]
MQESLLKRLVAEFIGVFTLCFIGILAIANAGMDGLLQIAFAHGLAIFVMVAALGAVSGAHFNPAVTFGFVVARRMELGTAGAYVVAQLAGGLIAALIIFALFGGEYVAGGTPQLGGSVTAVQAIVLEAIATFFLVLVVFGSAVDARAPKYVFPLAIGLVIVADILAIGPLTGAAMNPARVLGPALASGTLGNHWVYWAGPLLGGAMAGALHLFMLPGDTKNAQA